MVDGGEEGPSTPTGSDTYLYSQEQELGVGPDQKEVQ